MAEDGNNEEPMICPFCGWEATGGEYVMLLVRFFHLGVLVAAGFPPFVPSSCLPL